LAQLKQKREAQARAKSDLTNKIKEKLLIAAANEGGA